MRMSYISGSSLAGNSTRAPGGAGGRWEQAMEMRSVWASSQCLPQLLPALSGPLHHPPSPPPWPHPTPSTLHPPLSSWYPGRAFSGSAFPLRVSSSSSIQPCFGWRRSRKSTLFRCANFHLSSSWHVPGTYGSCSGRAAREDKAVCFVCQLPRCKARRWSTQPSQPGRSPRHPQGAHLRGLEDEPISLVAQLQKVE